MNFSTAEIINQLGPVLQGLEQEREKLRSDFWRNTLIVLAIAVVVAVVGYLFVEAIAIGAGVFLAFIGIGWAYSHATQSWRDHFKWLALKRRVQTINPNLTYDPNRHISQEEYRLSMLFHNAPAPDRYRGEDYIEGVVGKTDIRLSELHTEYQQVTYDSKGNRQERWVTIFRGLFISADFHKDFYGITLVLPDDEQRMLGGLGQWLQSLSAKMGNQPGELVKMEDPEFERLFKVYSTDQIEARYILTPNLIARLVDFQKKLRGHIRVSFIASRMYLAIPTTHDHFEPPSLFASSKRLIDPQVLAQYLEELRFIVSIVDELNLNTRIWAKR